MTMLQDLFTTFITVWHELKIGIKGQTIYCVQHMLYRKQAPSAKEKELTVCQLSTVLSAVQSASRMAPFSC